MLQGKSAAVFVVIVSTRVPLSMPVAGVAEKIANGVRRLPVSTLESRNMSRRAATIRLRWLVYNDSRGIRRFSLVTSGRKVSGRDMAHFCEIYRRLGRETGLQLCASMGLLDEESMKMLRDAGVTRYHCNLESAPSFFPSLCTTHTIADKIATFAPCQAHGNDWCVRAA